MSSISSESHNPFDSSLDSSRSKGRDMMEHLHLEFLQVISGYGLCNCSLPLTEEASPIVIE